VFLTLAGGSGLPIYLILSLLMSSAPKQEVQEAENKSVKNYDDQKSGRDMGTIGKKRDIMAIAIVIIGFLIFVGARIPTFWVDWDILWPIIIILIGFSIVSNLKSNRK
jgi:hypothetical protein